MKTTKIGPLKDFLLHVYGNTKPLSSNHSIFFASFAADIDYTLNPILILEARSSRACANVTILTDQITEQVECFDLIASTDSQFVNVRGSRTTLCIIDIPPPISAVCLLNQTNGTSSASVSCTTSNVPPDTQIEFSTCEIDGTPSDICK